jgi:hypothetical protein
MDATMILIDSDAELEHVLINRLWNAWELMRARQNILQPNPYQRGS